MPNPTNKDIMQTLGHLEEKIDGIDERVKFTNGKVAALMEDKIRRDERERVLGAHPTVKTEQGDVIVQSTAAKMDAQTKVLLAIAGFITTVATVIGVLAGVAK
jgi:hypothetical protein